MERSYIDVAIELMEKKKSPQNIHKFLDEVCEISGLTKDDSENIMRLYTDMTTSSLFVYCGDDEWDLKIRKPITLYDKDGSYFISSEDIAKAKEEEKQEKEALKNAVKEEPKVVKKEEPIVIDEKRNMDHIKEEEIVYEDTEVSSDYNDEDEEKYENYMDDYENLYDDE